MKEPSDRENRNMNKMLTILFVILLNSCHSDTNDIIVQGQVLEDSNKPILNATVLILCWSYGNTPDGSYTECDSAVEFTNILGEYSHKFGKGAFVEIIVSKPNYDSKHKAITIDSKEVVVDVELRKK